MNGPIFTRAFALGLTYWLAVVLAIELVSPVDKIALFWPPNAIAAAALILSSRKHWPLYLIAISLAYFAARVARRSFAALRLFRLLHGQHHRGPDRGRGGQKARPNPDHPSDPDQGSPGGQCPSWILVNEILDLSAIEAGKQSLAKEELSTVEIVTEREKIIEEKARTNNIDVVTKIPKNLAPLYADKRAAK